MKKNFVLILLLFFKAGIALADGPCYLKSASTGCFKPVDTASGGTGVSSTATYPSSGVIVTRTSTDTGGNRLKNKDLEANSLKIVDSADVTKKIGFNLGSAASGAIATIGFLAAGSVGINLPQQSTTLIGTTDSITVQNKTFDDSNAYTSLDTNFVLEASGDSTKKFKFDLSQISTGTTRTLQIPNFTSDTFQLLTSAQSPTNKTFDSTSTMTGVKIASFTPDGTHTLTAPATTDTLVVQGRSISTTAPITGGGDLSANRTIAITQAATAANGYVSSTDWNTFNNKVSATRAINTTAPITGGGDLSADRTIAITQAATAANGYLSSTDWNTFNNKVSTPTVSNYAPARSTGLGGGTSGTNLFYVQFAKFVFMWGCATAGTTTTGIAALGLPGGMTLDTANMSASNLSKLGQVSVIHTSASIYTGNWENDAYYDGTNTEFAFDNLTSGSRLYAGQAANNLVSTSDKICVNLAFPVQ